MPDQVRITEVSPRDGLQNEPGAIPTSDKVRLIRALIDARPDEIEVSSFVSAKWIPQLGDAAEVFDALASAKPGGMVFSALVPNERGLEAALAVNARHQTRLIDKVSVFTAASETFARKNTNASIAETLERFKPVIARAHAAGLAVRGYLSCVIACPFEGPILPSTVSLWASRLLDLGIDELDLGDTIGAATPLSTRALLEPFSARGLDQTPAVPLTLHLHDTFGTAPACVQVALDCGVRSFDASAAGLGGCPYASTPARRAPGNIATEALVRTVTGAGFVTRVDPLALESAALVARSLVQQNH